MSSTTPCLVAEHVSKQFLLPGGRLLVAVDDADLTIERGACVLFRGASGSGKSTLLGLMGGLARPTRGRIFFDQYELGQCSDMQLARLRRRMGFVFQNFKLLPRLPLWDGITYGLIPRGPNREERRKVAAGLLDRLGLLDRIDQSPEQLSGGEQQRVALARALVGDPELIIADEPTSNLDDRSAGVVVDWLRDLHAQGRTLLVATHDARFSLTATQHLELDQGRIQRS